MTFEFKKLSIPEVILIQPKVLKDERGFFMESYKYSEFKANGIESIFIQDNHSKSIKNVLRGLHFQTNPKAQAKLLRCTKGKVLDVAVDLRKTSKTYKKWVAEILSEENNSMLYIPKGFAHGFLTLSEEAELLYKTDEEYSPENDGGIFWNDPDIAITWNIVEPIISEKDKKLPLLKDLEHNF